MLSLPCSVMSTAHDGALPALTDGPYKEGLQASSNATIINKVAS